MGLVGNPTCRLVISDNLSHFVLASIVAQIPDQLIVKPGLTFYPAY